LRSPPVLSTFSKDVPFPDAFLFFFSLSVVAATNTGPRMITAEFVPASESRPGRTDNFSSYTVPFAYHFLVPHAPIQAKPNGTIDANDEDDLFGTRVGGTLIVRYTF
jgi:hypothetical protein